MKGRNRPYLSYSFQKSQIKFIRWLSETALNEYIKKKIKPFSQNLLPHHQEMLFSDLEEEIRNGAILITPGDTKRNFSYAKILLAYAMSMELSVLANAFLERIIESENRDDLPLEQRVQTNNSLLKEYIQQLKNLFVIAKGLLGRIKAEMDFASSKSNRDKLDEFIKKAISECDAFYKHLDVLTDMRIYQVQVSDEELREMSKDSIIFQPHKKEIAIWGGVFLGGAGLLAAGPFVGIAIAGAIPGVLGFIAGGTIGGAMAFPGSYAVPGGLGLTLSKMKAYGHACARKQGFSPNQILGILPPVQIPKMGSDLHLEPSHDQSDEVINRDGNAYRIPKNKEKGIIYVLDGRNPEEVFRNGINYPDSVSPHPYVFFHNFKHAQACATLFINGKEYNPLLGFDVDGWKLDNFHQKMKSEIVRTKIFPPSKSTGIDEIITSYANPFYEGGSNEAVADVEEEKEERNQLLSGSSSSSVSSLDEDELADEEKEIQQSSIAAESSIPNAFPGISKLIDEFQQIINDESNQLGNEMTAPLLSLDYNKMTRLQEVCSHLRNLLANHPNEIIPFVRRQLKSLAMESRTSLFSERDPTLSQCISVLEKIGKDEVLNQRYSVASSSSTHPSSSSSSSSSRKK